MQLDCIASLLERDQLTSFLSIADHHLSEADQELYSMKVEKRALVATVASELWKSKLPMRKKKV